MRGAIALKERDSTTMARINAFFAVKIYIAEGIKLAMILRIMHHFFR